MRISDWSSDVCSSDLRHLVAQISELSHLDGCAERAGTQLEPEALIGIAGIGLDKADDGEIHKSKADGVHIRNAQQASITQAHRLQNIQFGLQRQSAERDRKSTRLNSSHYCASRIASSARKTKRR